MTYPEAIVYSVLIICATIVAWRFIEMLREW